MSNYGQLADRADKLEKAQKWDEAGEMWERLGDTDRAIAAYKRSGKGERAAQLLLTSGRFKESAATYQSMGLYAQAAGVYERMNAFDDAARCYLRGNQREQAALTWEKAGACVDAAKVFYTLGNVHKAVQLYERAGDTATAQALRNKHDLAGLEKQSKQDAAEQHIARLLSGEAGFANEQQVVRAVLYLLQRDRLADGVRLYSQCREDIGYPLITAVTGQPEIEKRLAKMLYAAKDYYKTAQVLENLGKPEQAAMLYERGDAFDLAAELYAKIGNDEKAAEMFERSNKYSEAAVLYLRAGKNDRAAINYERCQDYFLAGKLFFEIGKANKSLQLLQRVQRTEPRFVDATLMMGQILTTGGYKDLALTKYQEAMIERKLDDAVAPVQYRMGLLLQELGRVAEAKKFFEGLLSWRFDYEDVKARLEGLAAVDPAPSLASAPVAATTDSAETSAAAALEQAQAHVVTIMDGFELLKEIKLFSELSLDETRAVYHMTERLTFDPNQIMIEQGKPGEALYVLRSGKVSVRRVANGQEIELAQLGAGAPVGEMSLFDDSPTSARVVAIEPVEAFTISKESFHDLLAGSDKLGLRIYSAFVKTLTERLRETSARAS